MSERFRNTLIVFDNRSDSKTYFRISKDDPEYNPKYHMFYRTGYSHSNETKRKIGKRGKIAYHNPETRELKFIENNDIPLGFVRGYLPNLNKSEHTVGTVWYHNPNTKVNIRINPDDKVPSGFIKGRYFGNNPGFDKANSMINVVNFLTRTAEKVFSIDYKIHGPDSGKSSDKTIIFTFDGKIFTSYKKLIDYADKLGYTFGRCYRGNFKLHIGEFVVPKPHHNASDMVNEFRQKYQGKRLKEIGFMAYRLSDFDIEKHKEKEIMWTK
jgi:hypothetical protein